MEASAKQRSHNDKRKLGPPTGTTPGKPVAKSSCREEKKSRKSLVFSVEEQKLRDNPIPPCIQVWLEEELAALVQYVALFHDQSRGNWPTHKNIAFWDVCARGIHDLTNQPLRTGNACRLKVQKWLKKTFDTIEEAESFYNINYFDDSEVFEAATPVTCTPTHVTHKPNSNPVLSPVFQHSPSKTIQEKHLPGDIISSICKNFWQLTKIQRLQLITKLFSFYLSTDVDPGLRANFVPTDFLELSSKSMKVLCCEDKPNVVYLLAKSLGEMRPDNSGTRMPIDRMPFGLIAYNISFFASDDASNLHPLPDYAEWQTTMFAQFGHKWDRLHRGPMWSYDEGENDEANDEGATEHKVILEEVNECVEELELLSQDSEKSDVLAAAITETFGADGVPVMEEETWKRAAHISTLWSGLTSSQQKECLGGDHVHSDEIARQEGIVPQARKVPTKKRDPMTAKVNVAGLSARQLQRKIQEKGFTRDTDIQVEALKTIKSKNPKGRWWIKADACDIRCGSRESIKHEWSGDSDLGDGVLQKLYGEYKKQLDFVESIGIKGRRSSPYIIADLKEQRERLIRDVPFLDEGHKKAKELYEKKKKQVNVAEDSLFALAWEVVAFDVLIATNAALLSRVGQLHISSMSGCSDGRKLNALRKDMGKYTKDIYSKKREAASHILVFMIADELRNMKPYAVPVRFLPYRSITDGMVRNLRDELRDTMKSLGMVPVGFVTDGEWNSLRTMGTVRPISIIQLQMDALREAKSIKSTTIERYLTPQRNRAPETPAQPIAHHPAVPVSDLEWLADYMDQGFCFEDAIHILRRTHFPFFYDPQPWIPGKPESKADCLKSLMATYLYRKKVKDYTEQGINFKEHLYVPEKDEKLDENFHEREDHNHLLKRIATCLRSGTIPNVDLHHFRDALHDPNTGLTYEALTGKRKQSVPDAEKLFSVGVRDFMVTSGHADTAKFVEVIHNWHKASDGRGIDEQTRSRYNSDMLKWLLDDWMPWNVHHPTKDYTILDINRRIRGIQGCTREVIVGLVANIESQESRREECRTRGLPPEHPRASTTDDVEGFFSLLHEMLGPIFDHKSFISEFPKIMNEFNKRIDPDLPFFYWTGVRERYRIGVLPSFNKPSAGGVERLDKVVISRRADPGVFVANRAHLPQRGSLTARANFHAHPQPIPPCEVNQ